MKERVRCAGCDNWFWSKVKHGIALDDICQQCRNKIHIREEGIKYKRTDREIKLSIFGVNRKTRRERERLWKKNLRSRKRS